MKFWQHIAIVLFILSAGACAAFAHSKMSGSIPQNGGTAKAGLEKLQLGFEKPVKVVLVKVKRTDQAANVAIISKDKPAFEKMYRIAVSPLAAGTYSVNWTAVAKDGHVMKGELTFTLKP